MAEQEVPERHASWLELFFDLIIVVAVAQLAHVLHPSPGHPIGLADAGLFIVLYYAVWSVWTSFTLYANVAGERTRRQSMLIAMFGIAVMAAAIPEAAGDRARAFAIAYVACRVLATRTWSRTGTFLGAWPAAQYGTGLLPWLISIWVPAPGRYWLWGLGTAADILISYLQSRHPEQRLAGLRDEAHRRRERAYLRGRVPRRIVLPAGARLNVPHLGERLGLFVIIVLGEAVMQVVVAAGEISWTPAFSVAALAGFGLLVCLWWLTLEYGAAAVPGFGGLRARITLPAHFAMTAGVAATAAGLGALAEHADGHLAAAVRWTLCGGMTAYFLTSAVLGAAARAPLRWLLGWALPAVLVPVLLAVFGGGLAAWWIVVGLLAVAYWQVSYPAVMRRLTDGRATA
ncbi:hypothetical protein Aple_090480 [Acrocarpospora pleiomorpha]|uniref:Low temperature requirement protein A n=1 Tax=Acrocarpospora pleiomorpha TaxID=90975 RepID=A0A5M3Y1U0_9ACTN|nr:low temperature requirement protein A [Acrocarpospora pleiomorpha]GES26149.1 hypothetical protein Aple_090480 [Acrocarpospora pleiomorpha]